eukprot:scpid68290/ scgid1583/ 
MDRPVATRLGIVFLVLVIMQPDCVRGIAGFSPAAQIYCSNTTSWYLFSPEKVQVVNMESICQGMNGSVIDTASLSVPCLINLLDQLPSEIKNEPFICIRYFGPFLSQAGLCSIAGSVIGISNTDDTKYHHLVCEMLMDVLTGEQTVEHNWDHVAPRYDVSLQTDISPYSTADLIADEGHANGSNKMMQTEDTSYELPINVGSSSGTIENMTGIYEDPLPPTDCQRAIYDDPLPPTDSPMEDFKINMKRISLRREDDFSTSAMETEYDNVIKVPILTTSGDATQEADANLYDNIGKADCKQIPGAMQTSSNRSAHDNAVVLISDDIEFSISA